ncbi:phosphatase PAP2 family protein [Legionella saoudiensis]|uniref:phosphatase PAP2 family protein n=1 Tax=Legionella saoudiensis TaxID=1750561 RepID=UPI0018C2A2ED|nr:phosphatase PAP2 family protein [Legionella saoudiensis]
MVVYAVYIQSPYLSINQEIYILSKKIQNAPVFYLGNFISLFGDKFIILPTFATTGFLLYLKKQKWLALHLCGVIIIATLLASILKNSVAFPRPELVGTALKSYAFPSRHVTIFSAYITFLFALMIPKIKQKGLGIIVVILLIIIESISRIILQVHWISDVVGGAFLGAFCGFMGAYSFSLKANFTQNIRLVLIILFISFLLFAAVFLILNFFGFNLD